MIITWYGEGCFRLQSGDRVVLIDPPDASSGLTAPRGKYDVLLKTLTPWPAPFVQEGGEGVLIRGSGEYDVGDITVRGYALSHESSPHFFKTAYIVTMEDISVGVLGHISSDLLPATVENFEEVDIVLGPAGGSPFLEQDRMVRLLKQITPKIFIPSFYKIPGLKRKSESADEVIYALQDNGIEAQEKYVCKKKDLAEIKKTVAIRLKI
jgi:L-ascorbate metabolism protein UlaG (beta-lactamase superfamily)